MNIDIWRPRLAESIAQVYRQCWGKESLQSDGSRRINRVIVDDTLTGLDLSLIAQADLILPFATAGLLTERDEVSELPAPAKIRLQVRERELHVRCMSIGCQIAGATTADDSAFREEAGREWSTWITYCMQAHSPELRAALGSLPEAVAAISTYQERPRRLIRRLGPDGELLISQLPVRSDDDERIEPLLDHCETIAAYADSFRSVEDLFPELFRLVNQYSQNDIDSPVPFHPYLWPFSLESFRYVVEIAERIRQLARVANGYDDGDTTQMGESSYAQV